MALTTDPDLPCLHETDATGQNKCYLVLSEQERAKGFIRPVRDSYIHVACGVETRMGSVIAETYARQPTFYGATYCVGCKTHFDLVNAEGVRQFAWLSKSHDKDGTFVGE